jgi:hypothetical protein
MTKRRKPKKPTGETGPVLISAGAAGARASFQQLAFPTRKEDIEGLIMRGFIPAAGTLLPFRVQSYVPNMQDDFDFNLITSAGPKSVELAEVAFLKTVGGSYEAASPSYKPYDFAQNVLDLILRKSAHYGGRPPAGLHLVLYITHWAFTPSRSSLSLLQFWTLERAHGFEGIYWYAPIMSDEGIAFLVYPTLPEHWANFDPEALRAAVVQNLDPKGWVPGRS